MSQPGQSADLRALLDPLASVRAARPRWRVVPDRTYVPDPFPGDPDPAPVVIPGRTEVFTAAADLPDEVVSPQGVDLGGQIALVAAALAQYTDVVLRPASAEITLPATFAANTDVDIAAAWVDGPTQTVPVAVSVLPLGPSPLQVRAITARALTTTVTGVTVRFRARRAVLGLDPEDRYVVHAIYSHTPPFIPESP